MTHRVLGVALLVLATLSGTSRALAYSSGPPDGFAGDPPIFRNCTACHSSFPVNSGNGALALQGLPLLYDAGETYLLTIHLEDPGQKRWGFEMTVIHPDDGLEAGSLIPVDDTYVQLSPGSGTERDYVKHRLAGTFPNTNSADWQVWWVAPQPGEGPASFYVAGNAANNNDNQSLDYIYTIDRSVAPMPAAGVELPTATASRFLRAAPNPVRVGADLDYELAAPGPVELRVADVSGRTVRFLDRAVRGAGIYRVHWDGRGESGARVPAGMYFYLLNTSAGQVNLRAVVIR